MNMQQMSTEQWYTPQRKNLQITNGTEQEESYMISESGGVILKQYTVRILRI